MSDSRRLSHIVYKASALVVVVALGAVLWSTSNVKSGPVELGSAAVRFGDQPARSVETVQYGREVNRVADLVIADGVPAEHDPGSPIAEVWNLVDEMWPASLDSSLTQLSVFEGEPRGLVGVVHHSAVNDGWILSLDLADIEDQDLINETIVHELVHIVNFDASTFRLGDSDECDGVLVELGCATAGDFITRYAAEFWPAGVVIDGADSAFATNYARVDVTEDIAETFVAWTFDWKVEPGSGLDRKIDFVAGDPTLAALHRELTALLR